MRPRGTFAVSNRIRHLGSFRDGFFSWFNETFIMCDGLRKWNVSFHVKAYGSNNSLRICKIKNACLKTTGYIAEKLIVGL